MRDASDQIAALSLHALAEMVPILGRDIVIGGKSKTYFKEGRPKVGSIVCFLTHIYNRLFIILCVKTLLMMSLVLVEMVYVL